MKPRILVLYYSQSGQLRQILDNITNDIKDDVTLDYGIIEPEKPFPFPWKAYTFFDAMPETVERVPVSLKPLPQNIFQQQYDLVIVGYQPWFLNPSQPTTSFLKSEDAKKLLKGKPVITVVGCRNMWLHGQEKVKEDLVNIGAKLVGNIVLIDKNPNLTSLLTIIRWQFKGQKERSKYLPAAGVQDADIAAAHRFGKPILEALQQNKLDQLQNTILNDGAVELNPGLVLLEQQGIKNFRYWAKFIREKGGPGDPNRAGRVTMFKRLLLMGIFVLSPIKAISAKIKLQLNKKSLARDVDYFKNVGYEAGRI